MTKKVIYATWLCMKLVLATQNRDKIREIKKEFSNLSLEIISLEDLTNFPSIIEDGKTLRENALKKARIVAEKIGTWALGDDTGLIVAALGEKPGIFSARFAGPKATYKENCEKLLQVMKEIPQEKRRAYFSTILALVHPDGREVVLEGKLEGTILGRMRGSGGFGYDPLFYVPRLGKTLAEISLEEKNIISHRGQALRKMKVVVENICR